MEKKSVLKLINDEHIVKSLLFKSCTYDMGCGTQADLCPNEGVCDREFCLCAKDG